MSFPWSDLTELASCLCQALTDRGRPDTCFCGVIGGAIVPLDYCATCEEKCGMAWVRLVSVEEAQFGITENATGLGGNPCAAPLQATIEVGVTRCAPTMDDNGEPPTMADQLAAAEGQTADMMAALYAIRCCYEPLGDVVVGTWTPIGPDGVCMGGSWSITVTQV